MTIFHPDKPIPATQAAVDLAKALNATAEQFATENDLHAADVIQGAVLFAATVSALNANPNPQSQAIILQGAMEMFERWAKASMPKEAVQ